MLIHALDAKAEVATSLTAIRLIHGEAIDRRNKVLSRLPAARRANSKGEAQPTAAEEPVLVPIGVIGPAAGCWRSESRQQRQGQGKCPEHQNSISLKPVETFFSGGCWRTPCADR